MKISKKVISLLVASVLAFSLAGCGIANRTAISSDKFTSVMEDNKYTVEESSDVADTYKADKAFYAYNDDSSVVLIFMEFGSAADAKAAYDSLKTDLDSIKTDSSKSSEKIVANYSKYVVENSDEFGVISRTDNTIVCADVTTGDKSEITSVLKELGY